MKNKGLDFVYVRRSQLKSVFYFILFFFTVSFKKKIKMKGEIKVYPC